jgi:ABC-type multidrug transport system fused ATPase/permease subunit
MQNRIDVGGVIRRVFKIYVDQASVLMPAAAVVFVFTGIIAALLVVASPALALVALLIDLIAGTLFTGMVVELVADVQDGRRDSSPGQLLRAVTPVLGQLILVGIIAAIGIVIGFVLIIIPGLFLITIWSVAAPVVVLENPGALAALRRSRELVSGNGWQVFGVILVLYIVVGVVSFIIEAAAESAGSGAGIVVRVIVGVLTAPLASLAAAVLYFELGGAAPSQPPPPGTGGSDVGGPPSPGGNDAERAFGS